MNEMVFETKSNRVAQILRAAIVDGTIAPGDWIRVDDWAARLRISQTPIREAIRRLEAEGFVQVFPHRGAQVSGYSRSEFADVYRMRGVLEGLSARLVTERRSADERRALATELRGYQEQLHRLADKDDVAGSREINRRLHMAIYEAAQSPKLFTTIQSLWATFPWDTLALLPNRLPRAAQQHDEIINAIEAGNGELAESHLREHVEGAARQLLRSEAGTVPSFLHD